MPGSSVASGQPGAVHVMACCQKCDVCHQPIADMAAHRAACHGADGDAQGSDAAD